MTLGNSGRIGDVVAGILGGRFPGVLGECAEC
jgi:hypothetical protein